MTARNSFDLWLELVKTSFKMRYQNSILGFLWVLIKPYAMFGIMYLIFSSIIRANVDNYAVYLLCGVIFITFVNELLVLGQMSLLERANIILKVQFPRYIAILSALTSAVINLFINLILIFIIAFFLGINMTFISFSWLMFVVLITLTWGLGIAFVTSVLTVYIRDLKNIIELALFMMQYATPVFYDVNDPNLIGSDLIRKGIQWNPLTMLMNQFRAGIGVYGEIDVTAMLIFLGTGVIFSLVAYAYFKSSVKKVAEFF